MIPNNIDRHHILMAIDEVDKKGIPETRKSTKYNLLYMENSYPPKYVISIANRYSNGFELLPGEFSGGQESNQFLRNLGFKIVVNNRTEVKGPIFRGNIEKKNRVKMSLSKPPHNQRCSDCKNVIIEMFRRIYGTVKIEHKMEIKARLEDY